MAKYKNRDVTLIEEVSDAEYANKVTIQHPDGTKEDVKKTDVTVSLAEAAKLRNKTLGGSDPMLLPKEERPKVATKSVVVPATSVQPRPILPLNLAPTTEPQSPKAK